MIMKKAVRIYTIIAIQAIFFWSPKSIADQCDSVLPLGVVETFTQTNDITSTISFRTWLKQAEAKGACNQGGFDYTRYFESSLSGSLSLCDAANKSIENSTSLDGKLRDQSITQLRSVNNAAIEGWKYCIDSTAIGFKYTYKIIPDINSVQLVMRYVSSANVVPNSVPVTLSDFINITCQTNTFTVNMEADGTSCTIINPTQASSLKITAKATHGVSFLNIPKLRRNPTDQPIWPETISCGTSYRYYDNQGHEISEKATRKFNRDIKDNGEIYYLYEGATVKDKASIHFDKFTGYATSTINDEAVAGDGSDRTREGFTDYIFQGCGGIFVEYLPH